MSINQGLRHDRSLREQAAQMFERGFGYGLTASRLGVSAATMREWQKMYRVIGRDGLRVKGQNVCLARRVAGVRFGLFECRLSGCSRCR